MIDGDGIWHLLQGLLLGWALIRISMLQSRVDDLEQRGLSVVVLEQRRPDDR